MQNYNNQQPIMASVSQLNYLKRLGYTGDTNITVQQANELIKQLSAKNQNQNQQNSYQAPAQTTNYQPTIGNNEIKTIVTKNGEEIQISRKMLKELLDVDLNIAEYNYFVSVCDLYGLNPYVKDIYAIKYGQQAATFVIDYKVMQQAADNDPSFDGLKTGVLYIDTKGNPQERDGAYILPGEQLLGGWCDVYRKGRSHTNRVYALYEENKKTKSDGTINANWKDKPCFMITKVAKAQALREAFPNMFSNNTYTSDEIDDKPKFNADFTYDSETGVIEAQEKETATIEPTIESKQIQEEKPAQNQKPTQEEIFSKHLSGIKQEVNF